MKEVICVRRLMVILTVCVLFLSVTMDALGISYSDRGRYYLYVTTQDTETYAITTKENEDGTTSSVYTATGTLPAGTPISTSEVLDETYQKVIYMDQNSSTHTVIIRKDVIKGNYVTLDFGESLGKVRIPRPAAANAGFIRDYLNYRGISVTDSQINQALGILESETTPNPVSPDLANEMNDTFSDSEIEEIEASSDDAAATPESSASAGTSSKTSTKKTAKPTATPKPSSARESVKPDGILYLLTDDGEMHRAELVELGLARSTITINGTQMTVETKDLTWSSNAGKTERLAIVNAPKTGSASLRKTSKKSSKVLKKITTGTIMQVFEIGDTMTGVYVNGLTGYMLNSSLTLVEIPDSYTTGKLSYKGSFTNTHRINLYSQAKESSKKISGVHAGDEVIIYSDTGTWTELDIHGFHGYILSKFVTPDEVEVPLSDLSELTGSVSWEDEDVGEEEASSEDEEESDADAEASEDVEESDADPEASEDDPDTAVEEDAEEEADETEQTASKQPSKYNLNRDPYR